MNNQNNFPKKVISSHSFIIQIKNIMQHFMVQNWIFVTFCACYVHFNFFFLPSPLFEKSYRTPDLFNQQDTKLCLKKQNSNHLSEIMLIYP